MADMRRFGLLDALLLLLVFVAAAGARASYLMQCAENGQKAGPLRVQDPWPIMPGYVPPEGMRGGKTPSELDVLIHNVQKDLRFHAKAPFASSEEPTAHVAPGYPYLVGLLGQQVPEGQLDYFVRWIQVGLGTFTAGFYFLFARRAFRSLLVGTLAGLLTALHPYWVVEVAQINDGTLASCALALCLLLGSQAGEKGGALKSLLLGASLGGLALVRAEFLPFSFVMLVWFLLRSRSLRLGWLCALCAFLGFGTALAPWTIRNYEVFQEPIPIVSSTYYHLWIGNNPEATGGPVTEKMLGEAPREELQQLASQPARYARLGQEVLKEMQDRPVPTVQRRLKAILVFLLGQRWLDDGTLVEVDPVEVMPDWLRDVYPIAFPAVLLGMLTLGFLGWRWTYGWRRECIPAALAVVWVPLPYVLGHGTALSGARLPLDGVLLCLSAFTVGCLIPGVGGHLLGGAEAATSRTSEEPPPEM